MDCDPNYISSGEEEASQMFITQSSFRETSTQDVDSSADFFDALHDISFGDEPGVVEKCDMNNVFCGDHSQFTDADMCSMVFDFTSGNINNGWTILSQDPQLVRRHSDEKNLQNLRVWYGRI